MTEDLDRLDVLAAAATPGPWASHGAFIDGPDVKGLAETYATNFDAPGDPYADAAFIAACDPATIRSLVAAVRERDELAMLLREAAQIIESADRRAEAADGPVGHARDNMDDREWRRLYLLVSDRRAALHREDGA